MFKSAVTFNHSNPDQIFYKEMEVVRTIEAHGMKFVIHFSPNSLIDCYMLSEFSTGFSMKSFGVPKDKEKHTEEMFDKIVEASNVFLNNHSQESIQRLISKLNVVNFED